MNDAQLDPTFDRALRQTLVAHVQSTKKPQARKHARLYLVAGALAGAVMLGGVGATAAGFFQLPGVPITQGLSSPTTGTHTGTATVDLGAAPDGATGIEVELTCLSAGKFTYPDGATMQCTPDDLGTSSAWSKYVLPLSPINHGVTITTDPGNAWKLVGRYVSQVATEWKVNAKGESYGVEVPGKGAPVLLAVIATNGEKGYVYAAQMKGTEPTSPEEAAKNMPLPRREIPVYLSDGETQVGVFMAAG
jgi:hypothetical protein